MFSANEQMDMLINSTTWMKRSTGLSLAQHKCLNKTLRSMALFRCSRYYNHSFHCPRLWLRNCNFCIRDLKKVYIGVAKTFLISNYWLKTVIVKEAFWYIQKNKKFATSVVNWVSYKLWVCKLFTGKLINHC